MIEIGLGVAVLAAAAAIAFGLADGLIPFPLSSGVVALVALLGAILILRGIYRLAHKRTTEPHALRSLGVMTTLVGITGIGALTLPAIRETLDLVTIGGFPLGIYLMGQGILVLFVFLLFAFAVWQGAIDRAHRP